VETKEIVMNGKNERNKNERRDNELRKESFHEQKVSNIDIAGQSENRVYLRAEIKYQERRQYKLVTERRYNVTLTKQLNFKKCRWRYHQEEEASVLIVLVVLVYAFIYFVPFWPLVTRVKRNL
jgi:ATP-dependent Zn protease